MVRGAEELAVEVDPFAGWDDDSHDSSSQLVMAVAARSAGGSEAESEPEGRLWSALDVGGLLDAPKPLGVRPAAWLDE